MYSYLGNITLGPYQILSPLGKGGMGEVFRARDTRLERDVAIKVLPEHLSGNADALKRFQREAKSLAALSHPNIVTIHDVGTELSVSYVVMELLEGETLRARIAHSALPWKKALEIAIPVAAGLSAAHSQGVIHRDLKPENIFVTSDDRVKILDFGLARREQTTPQGDATSLPTTSRVETESGIISGTVPYMSPEQLRGASVDARTDIFSFGCVLYEMLTGSRPFSGSNAADTVAAIIKEEPQSLSQSGKQIPLELDRVVSHCLEKNPDRRFQTARDLGFALTEVLSSSAIPRPVPKSAPRPIKLRKYAVIAVVLLLVAAGIGIGIRMRSRGHQEIQSIAVLPFANITKDPSSEYLSDGITESIIKNLSQLSKIRVMAPATVFHYKGLNIDPQKAGMELKVAVVLTGKIQQQGENLIISTDLMNVSDGSEIWGEQYNRNVSDVLALQADISKQITGKLRLKLTGEEEKALTRQYTQNKEAYQLYLKGRYHWAKFTEDEQVKSIEYFQQAIEKDPSYALAFTGLANAYSALGVNFWRPKDAFPKQKAAVEKALAIDQTLGEVHVALGGAHLFYDWDFPAAKKELELALQINPGLIGPRELLAYYYEALGQTEEAIQQLKRGLEVDPLSLVVAGDLADAFIFAHHHDSAIEVCRNALAMEPGSVLIHLILGQALVEKKAYEDAIQEFQKAAEHPEARARLAMAYARVGRKEEALKILSDLKELGKQTYLPPHDIAIIYIGLEDKDQALEWLEKAYQDRSPYLIWINADPVFSPLQSDPRFLDLLHRVGLAP